MNFKDTLQSHHLTPYQMYSKQNQLDLRIQRQTGIKQSRKYLSEIWELGSYFSPVTFHVEQADHNLSIFFLGWLTFST
jgi:hypothetical protein